MVSVAVALDPSGVFPDDLVEDIGPQGASGEDDSWTFSNVAIGDLGPLGIGAVWNHPIVRCSSV